MFINPVEAEKLKKKGKSLPDVTYEFAMGEIGRNAGLETANGKLVNDTVKKNVSNHLEEENR